MSSNLKVNTILPSTGTTVAVSGIASVTSSVSIASSCTATTFYGSGANLTSLPSQLTINNATANRVLTSDGGTTLNGEANLHFDGTSLAVGKSGSAGAIIDVYHATSNTIAQFESGDASAVVVLKDNSTYSSIDQNGTDFIIHADPGASHANSALSFKIDGNERLRIASDGDVNINGNLTVSSGTSGDAKLIIEADTDNNDEGDNPTLVFKQDGGIEVSSIGHGLLSGDQNGLVLANSCTNGYMSFATGSTNGHTNATERLRITSGGTLAINKSSGNYSSPLHIVADASENAITVEGLKTAINWRYTDGSANRRGGIKWNGSTGQVLFDSGVSGNGYYYQFDLNGSEKMRIDSSGNVTKPNSSCFQAVVNGSHVSAGSYVVFGSVDVNKGNDYNNSNGIFTAPVAGTYLFHISSIAFNNAATVFRFFLKINNGNTGSGSDAHLRIDRNNNGYANQYGANASYTYYKYMNANDTARVYFAPDDNSASAYGGSDYFKFGGHLIG